MKYAKYLAATGMTNNDVIAILQPHFPKFTKVQASMITHPDQYAVQLTPKAAALLPPLPPKVPARRKKPNRLVVYLDDDRFAAVSAAMEKQGSSNTQQFLENIISSHIEKETVN